MKILQRTGFNRNSDNFSIARQSQHCLYWVYFDQCWQYSSNSVAFTFCQHFTSISKIYFQCKTNVFDFFFHVFHVFDFFFFPIGNIFNVKPIFNQYWSFVGSIFGVCYTETKLSSNIINKIDIVLLLGSKPGWKKTSTLLPLLPQITCYWIIKTFIKWHDALYHSVYR